jgi:hypothetical protein
MEDPGKSFDEIFIAIAQKSFGPGRKTAALAGGEYQSGEVASFSH